MSDKTILGLPADGAFMQGTIKRAEALSALEPLIDEMGAVSDRVQLLEQGQERGSSNAAADSLCKMADHFLRGSGITVSQLPHIATLVSIHSGFGHSLDEHLPEVQS